MATKPEHGPVRAALEVTIGSQSVLSESRHAALIALARLLATQIDESGEEANNRLTAAYLSALKDVDRALGAKPSGGATSDNGGALGRLQSLKVS